MIVSISMFFFVFKSIIIITLENFLRIFLKYKKISKV